MTRRARIDRDDKSRAHTIGIVVFEGVDDLDIVGIASVLRKAALCATCFDITFNTLLIPTTDAVVVTTAGGLKIDQGARWEAVAQCRALVFPGGGAAQLCEMAPRFRSAVLDAARNGVLLCSICSGAFLLARMGLLTQRRVAVHARHAKTIEDVGQCFGERGLVKDGAIWSVGGVLESGYPKSVAMGVALLEHLSPPLVDNVLARLELPRRPVTALESAPPNDTYLTRRALHARKARCHD